MKFDIRLLGLPWEIFFGVITDDQWHLQPLKTVKKNAMFFKLFWYKVFVHWKLHILNFLVDSVLTSFAKLLTDWNTRHSLKRIIMYSSTKAITSFKQTNISLFLESEETFGYIQTGNTSTDYGHVTWQLSGLVTCNANLGKLKGLCHGSRVHFV